MFEWLSSQLILEASFPNGSHYRQFLSNSPVTSAQDAAQLLAVIAPLLQAPVVNLQVKQLERFTI